MHLFQWNGTGIRWNPVEWDRNGTGIWWNPVEWDRNPAEFRNSSGIHRNGPEFQWNPQEWAGIPAESTGMDWNSSGICKSGLTKVEGLVRNMNVVYFLYYNTFILNI